MKTRHKQHAQQPQQNDQLIPTTYRLPHKLLQDLMRVCLQRKLAKRKPYFQQDIATAALHDWLRRHNGH